MKSSCKAENYSSPAPRIAELDVLRGLAAIAVMLYHYTVVFPVETHHTNYLILYCYLHLHYGVFAVHLFFMISGFVIFMTLARTRTALDFAVSRFSRLYPVFWAAVLLTQKVVWLSPPAEYAVSWREAIVNLTMMGEPLKVRLVDHVYWSLVIEVVFYTIMLGIFLAGWLGRIERLITPWLLLQLAVMGTAAVFHHAIPQTLAVLLLLKYAHLFLAGILCYRIRFLGQTRTRLALFGACFLVEFIVQGMAAGAFAIVFFGLFFVLAKSRLEWISVRPLVFLGTISYSLYLVHQNIGYIIMEALISCPRLIQLLAAACLVILLATFLTYFVEQPALKLIRRIYKSHKQKQAFQP
jgi:peptidoglycan/LPS O-acetylase OafA/YrhL